MNKLKNVKDFLPLISKLLILVLIIAISPFNALGANTELELAEIPQVGKFESSLRLDVQSSVPVQYNKPKTPQIALGESEYNRVKREEAEANARASSSRDVVSRESSKATSSYSSDPGLSQKRALAQRAAVAYGIDWKILEAVWQVESGKSWDTAIHSGAGAQGPMQFMSGTWRAYGQDGNGDGVADVNNAEDALYGAANYLAAGGAAGGNVDQALLNYNHAQWYVNKVKAVANSI